MHVETLQQKQKCPSSPIICLEMVKRRWHDGGWWVIIGSVLDKRHALLMMETAFLSSCDETMRSTLFKSEE